MQVSFLVLAALDLGECDCPPKGDCEVIDGKGICTKLQFPENTPLEWVYILATCCWCIFCLHEIQSLYFNLHFYIYTLTSWSKLVHIILLYFYYCILAEKLMQICKVDCGKRLNKTQKCTNVSQLQRILAGYAG